MWAPGVVCYHYPLFLPAFMPAGSSFSFLSIIVSEPQTQPPPTATSVAPPSVTHNASRRGRLHDLWRAVIKPDFSRELYPFIYCLTILGVLYAATVGFYRCTLFPFFFAHFMKPFIREFSRFTLLKNTDVYL